MVREWWKSTSEFSPMRKILFEPHQFDPFSLGVAGVVVYSILFFLTPLLEALGVHANVPNAVSLPWETIAVLLLGLAGFVAGYVALPVTWVRRMPNIFREGWSARRAAWMVGGLALLGFVGKVVRLAAGGYFHTEQSPLFREGVLAGITGYLDLVGLIGLGIALLVHLSLKREKNPAVVNWKLMSYSLLALEFFYALFSCGRMVTITVVFLYLLTHWYMKELSWKKAVLVVVFAAVLIFPLGNACRNPSFFSDGGVSTTSGLRVVSQVPALVGGSIITRINQSFIFSHIYGRDFNEFRSNFPRDILIALGPPSALWKGKPASINVRGNEFGHRIGLLRLEDRKTSVGPTLPGDFYINFGLTGILLGMAFFGLLAKFFSSYLLWVNRPSPGGILAYSILWPVFLHGFEGWVVPLVAGLVKILVLLLVIHFIMRERNATCAPAIQ